jgi:hypothetical protein
MPIDECPICFEHMVEKDERDIINKNIIKTECGHLFCKSCLEKWQSNEPSSPPYNCPTCRQPIDRVDERFTVLMVDEETLYAIEQSEIIYDRLRSTDTPTQKLDSKLLCGLGTLGGGFIIYLMFYSFNL